MSFTRRTLAKRAQDSDIPKQAIAAQADLSPSNVSAYFTEAVISRKMEEKIGDSISSILNLLENCGPVRPDLYDTAKTRKLIEALKQQAYAIFLASDSQPSYFVKLTNKGVVSTRFFLSSTAFHFDIASAISQDLQERGYKAIVIPNQYADRDGIIAPTGDIRQSDDYKAAMGIEVVSA